MKKKTVWPSYKLMLARHTERVRRPRDFHSLDQAFPPALDACFNVVHVIPYYPDKLFRTIPRSR